MDHVAIMQKSWGLLPKILSGEKTIEQMGEDILEYCIKASSGEIIPKAVLLNQDDFIPWKRGVSL